MTTIHATFSNFIEYDPQIILNENRKWQMEKDYKSLPRNIIKYQSDISATYATFFPQLLNNNNSFMNNQIMIVLQEMKLLTSLKNGVYL